MLVLQGVSRVLFELTVPSSEAFFLLFFVNFCREFVPSSIAYLDRYIEYLRVFWHSYFLGNFVLWSFFDFFWFPGRIGEQGNEAIHNSRLAIY